MIRIKISTILLILMFTYFNEPLTLHLELDLLQTYQDVHIW